MTLENYPTRASLVKDWLKYPELRWLERYNFVAPVLLGIGSYAFGAWTAARFPQSGTSGWQMFVWAFLISTVLLYHTTYLVNSVAHTFGSRRFDTDDDSRNNWLVVLRTFGEGWHNNHHHYPASARQGFYWYEIDITYYLLVVLSWFGIVWNLKEVPVSVLEKGRSRDGAVVVER